MLIYRIENVNGKGVYAMEEKVYHFTKAGLENRSDTYCHPTPDNDPLISKWWIETRDKNKSQHYVFGFKDEEQLLDWFPVDGLRILHNYQNIMNREGNTLYGPDFYTFRVVVYNADDEFVKQGEKQCVFKKRFSSVVRKYSLKEFIEYVSERVNLNC